MSISEGRAPTHTSLNGTVAIRQARVLLLWVIYVPLAENPHRVGAPLRGSFEGYWRARRGECRAGTPSMTVATLSKILDISHWRDAYR